MKTKFTPLREVAGALLPLTLAFLAGSAASLAQQSGPELPLGEGPWEFNSYTPEKNSAAVRIRVSVATKGLTRPWALAFLPGGDILVSERAGRLRIIRHGVLDPNPIEGLPEVAAAASGGLWDIALHPDYESNHWVYFVYLKGGAPPAGAAYYATTALGRGRFDGTALRDVEDVFVANAWSTSYGGGGARILFAPDGTLFMTQPHRSQPERAQNTADHVGKVLRLNDDGSAPKDNPFVGRAGFLPEIYSYGNRVGEGLAINPRTGALWETEHGPQGGDEVNIIVPGGNYGWPLTTYGRNYDGKKIAPRPWMEGMVAPELVWVPSIATSGMMFYTGDRFPAWRGNLFVGSMKVGRMLGTGHLERIVLNENGEIARESLLNELHQRIRAVYTGPDGLVYLLTEQSQQAGEVNGALLRIEPVE